MEPVGGRYCITSHSRAAACDVRRYTGLAGLVSGTQPRIEADIPADGRPGCPRRPYRCSPSKGADHMLRLQAPLPERYTAATDDELATMIGAAKAALGSTGVHPRPPLPARRRHALGRRPGRLLRPLPPGGRPGRRRVHRLLRRPLHGRVGRRADRRPPTGPPPRPQRGLLHGRHGRHRPGRGGLGRPGPA